MTMHTHTDRQTVVILKFSVGTVPTWEEYRTAGEAVLRALGLELAGQTVVIKPNITACQDLPSPDTGVTVHPAAVAGMIGWCQSHGAGPIRVVEHVNCPTPSPACWGGTRYVEMAQAAGVDLWGPELRLADCLEASTPAPVRMRPSHLIPRLLLEPDTVLLNVAKMKTHGVVITLTLKNTQGLVEWNSRHFCSYARRHLNLGRLSTRQEHERWQRGLTECHVDLIRTLQAAGLPMLHVIEGLVGREGSGFLGHGANRTMGLMIAGLDPVAVDAVGAWCMGFDPQKVVALRVASEAGLGTNRLDAIRLVTLQADALVPVADLAPYAASPPFMTHLGLPELDQGRPYHRPPTLASAA